MYDAIIIGGGPAGFTAALYLARKKVKVLIVTSNIGGQAGDAPSVENYPAIAEISGIDSSKRVHVSHISPTLYSFEYYSRFLFTFGEQQLRRLKEKTKRSSRPNLL